MIPNIQLVNCFYLMIPILLWNLVLGSRITQAKVTSNAHSPRWLLEVEEGLRVIVFAFPLLMPLGWPAGWRQAGLALYVVGTLIYFASWLPLMEKPTSANGMELSPRFQSWRQSRAGLLAPRLTPLLAFLGIALLGSSWVYAILAVVFTGFHLAHGVQNLRARESRKAEPA